MTYQHLLEFITWNVSPTLVEVFGREIRWYGLLFALGFIVGQKIMTDIYKAEGRPVKDLDDLLMYMVIGTIAGARLGHCLFYEPEYYLANPVKILYVWEGGLASHGGSLGILLSIYLYCKKHKDQSYLYVLDRLTIVVAISGGFIRLGNLMNSEIIGRPTDVPWAFVFTSVDNLPRHPSQLYESISCFILAAVLYLIYKKYGAKLPEGRLFGLFLVVLFVLRFFYEFLKENQVAFENNLALNMGQILSIPFILIGIWLLWRSYRPESQIN